MANTFSLTKFTSKTFGTFFHQKSPFIATSYRGVTEFNDHRSYGVGDTIEIKIPGNPDVQRGLTTTPTDIIDRTVPYTISDNDIYNVAYNVDIRRINMQVVGGQVAFYGDPNRNPDDAKEINPQARVMIDNYIYPAYQVINGDLEKELAGKCKNSAFYSVIDDPDNLGPVNSYASISSVTALMDNLSFLPRSRYGVMNIDDAKEVADSLQNMFNMVINTKITREARLGGPDKGRLAGQDIFTSNSIEVQTVSPQYTANPTSAGVTVSSISAKGDQITFTGVIVTAGLVFNAGTKIAIPAVKLLNKTNKLALSKGLVITVSADANGDGAGNVTVTLSSPLFATGMQANVDVLPAAADIAKVFPAHKNNFFFVPMGIIANPVPLGEIVGADNHIYTSRINNVSVRCYIQGLVPNGTNDYRTSVLCATLAVPDYIIVLPSAI